MLYPAIAARSYRRYSTYVGATVAGIFTNSVFGVIYSFAFLALWRANPTAGGYDAVDAVTFVWLQQGLLATVVFFPGAGATADLGDRIRSGDIAIDLYRPVNLIAWYLAADLGRAAFHLLTRGVGPFLVGLALFDVRLPSVVEAFSFLVSTLLAVMVSFAFRFLVDCTGFWVLDVSGARVLAAGLATFFSGLALPLVLFPGWLGTLAEATPWAAMLQVPIDLWLGRHSGLDAVIALGGQLLWAAILLALCQLTLHLATRRVVVQGG